jgi:hypothetical protein
LDCEVGINNDDYWPEHLYCRVFKVDLTASVIDREYVFNVSNGNISSISAVVFERCNQVEFIPKEVLQQFVSLNGLKIWFSFMPVLRDDFFTADFVQIEYLQLQGNRMKIIESKAFKFLTKLKWIDLGLNEIQQITDNIFANNKQLEFISFFANLIETVHEKLFDDLRANKVKGRTAKINIPHIKHSETTIHQHHFSQRDHGPSLTSSAPDSSRFFSSGVEKKLILFIKRSMVDRFC